jgi:hypothetical protein
MAGFLNRWAKRKSGLELAEPELEQSKVKTQPSPPTQINSVTAVQDAAVTPESHNPVDATPKIPSLPTLEDVLRLTKDSDYSVFVQPGVDPAVQQAAMRQLFSDPHYNIMDGLDIYIDDYNKSDPIPLEMLKKMNQSQMLGLFKTPEEKEQDHQAELLERKDYEERLSKLDEAESLKELEKTASLAGENTASLPDENSNGIKADNSAKSLEIENPQETINTNNKTA